MVVCRYKIEVTGTVQGIGFRPFVYKEAVYRSLVGHVYNHSFGVTIEAQGSAGDLENFIDTIKYSHPPFADIHSLTHEIISPNGETEFKIIESRSTNSADTLISPDIAVCEECLNDIDDSADRRYRYPFTNCTNCGPRYTIIEGVPYDRPLTAMKDYKMCPECEAEYNNPLDRRYHSQPNACPACGPRLTLIRNEIRNSKSEILNKPQITNPKGDIISEVVKLLSGGKIVAIKGLGGFHLACDATNDQAVRRLRERKKRDEKPFAVMMPDVETVRQFCELSDAEEEVLTSAQRPIVLLKKKIKDQNSKIKNIASAVAPSNCYLGVMLPYTPLHHLLFSDSPRILVMTSANISDEPICYENDEALDRLKDIADHFLTHDRDIFIRTDDSVTRVMNGKPLMLRRARGYAPQPIILDLPTSTPENHHILAVGAELKNSVCLLKDNKAFISHHIGDLENSASYRSFEEAIGHLRKLYDIQPTTIAHDMHPDYFSSRWARSFKVAPAGGAEGFSEDVTTPAGEPAATGPAGVFLIEVQHHHAHIASCMAENRLSGPVIGIALDGTGYGTDGNIWGGEIMVATYNNFERVGQFEYIPMPGGEAAIKNPWQMALSYLNHTLGNSVDMSNIKNQRSKLDQISKFRISGDKIELVLKMIEKGVNSPLTSSCGRLFDAVAALLDLRNTVSYEGQAALELEMKAAEAGGGTAGYYPYDMSNKPYITISYANTIKAILEDIEAQITVSEIAVKFHNTLVAALSEATQRVSKRTGVKEVALSGGCFQNFILTEGLKKDLERAGFNVYTHSLVPPNDGGISLGQAAIARAKMSEDV